MINVNRFPALRSAFTTGKQLLEGARADAQAIRQDPAVAAAVADARAAGGALLAQAGTLADQFRQDPAVATVVGNARATGEALLERAQELRQNPGVAAAVDNAQTRFATAKAKVTSRVLDFMEPQAEIPAQRALRTLFNQQTEKLSLPELVTSGIILDRTKPIPVYERQPETGARVTAYRVRSHPGQLVFAVTGADPKKPSATFYTRPVSVG